MVLLNLLYKFKKRITTEVSYVLVRGFADGVFFLFPGFETDILSYHTVSPGFETQPAG